MSFRKAVLLAAALATIFIVLPWSRATESQPPSLRERLESEFPYDRQSDFSPQIWQTWKHMPDSDEFEYISRAPFDSWAAHHPTYAHTFLSDAAAASLTLQLYASVPAVIEAYAVLPLPVLRAGFFRYLILLARGGIYSDIDTAALQPALQWVPPSGPRTSYGLVIGIEADPDSDAWNQWLSRRVQFCQGTRRCARSSRTSRRRRCSASARAGQRGRGRDHTDAVFAFFNDARYGEPGSDTHEVIWTNFTKLEVSKQVRDVVVLSITSFSPGVSWMGSKTYDDPMAFVLHMFEGSRRLKPNVPSPNLTLDTSTVVSED
ncbi:hypothetical protein DFH09DRAFT_1408634 [Mycena vulgaris]|nr:hypothetical protein DFH09DRAFT_1408634 [Mycena vulgaris]